MEKAGARVKAACGPPPRRATCPRMSKGDDERERRLAEALRENLRRRKAQARGRDEGPPTPPDAEKAPG